MSESSRMPAPFIRYRRWLWAAMPDLESVGVLGAYLDLCGANNRPMTRPDREIAEFAKVSIATMRRRRADLAAAGYLILERATEGSAYQVTLGDRTQADSAITLSALRLSAPPTQAERTRTHAECTPLLTQEDQELQEEQGSLQGRFDDLAMARERRSFAGMSPDQIAERIREVSG